MGVSLPGTLVRSGEERATLVRRTYGLVFVSVVVTALGVAFGFTQPTLMEAVARHPFITMIAMFAPLWMAMQSRRQFPKNLIRLRETDTWARIVVLSADDTPTTVQGAIEQGAAGFIPKTAEGAVLEAALRVVLDGGIYVPPRMLGASGAPADASTLGLSPRQLDVLRWLIEGAPNKRICRELNLAESTVKTHVEAIFRRLDVNNRTQAVLAAARLGLRLPR